MWALIKHLFKKEAVLQELKAGPLSTVRAKDYLILFLLLSFVGQLPSLLRVLEGPGDLFPRLIGVVAGLLVVVIAYFIFRAMLLGLYRANGEASGVNFYERFFVLMLSASLRILPYSLLVIAVVLPAMSFMPPEYLLFPVLLLMAFVMFVIVWVYRQIRAGLRSLSGQTAAA